jgi:hypothetical protein
MLFEDLMKMIDVVIEDIEEECSTVVSSVVNCHGCDQRRQEHRNCNGCEQRHREQRCA